MMTTSFFLSRQIVAPAAGGRGAARWSARLFAAMVRNAGNAADYLNLPPNRVIELGTKCVKSGSRAELGPSATSR